MNKIVDFDAIGYVAATFPVAEAAKTYLKSNHLNALTGNVDVNGKNLVVTLKADGTVGFGTGAASDKLLGVMRTYEQDGFAAVQISGGVDLVPTASALTAGRRALAVNAKGELVEVEGGREATVAKPSETENLFASIIL